MRDVIVYIPSLVHDADQSADVMAQRFARALDRASDTAEPVYATKSGTDEKMAGGDVARRVSIVRTVKNVETPVADVYSFAYIPALTRGDEKSSSFMRAAATAFTVAWFFPRVLARWTAPSKTSRQKRQVLFATGMMVALILYFFTLIGAAVNATWDAFQATGAALTQSTPQDQPKTPPTPARLWWGAAAQAGEMLFFFVTVGGMMKAADVRAALNRVGREARAAAEYLNQGAGGGSLRGRLDDLLDHVLTNAGEDTRIHIVSYSFGSIVALDALFPRDAEPARRMEKVATLVTVGCPFDFVRTYFPRYFQDRNASPRVAPRWINVYDENDVLGSNFLDDATAQKEERGIGTANERPDLNIRYGPPRASGVLCGFRVHGAYFVKDDLRAQDCTEVVAPALFPTPPAAQTP